MVVKTTIKELINSKPSIMELSQNEDIPILFGFKIAKAINAIEDELESFEAARTKKLNSKAKKDENGNIVLKTDEKGVKTSQVEFNSAEDQEKFKLEVEELANLDIDIVIERISVSELVKASKELGKEVTIKPMILASLSWLFN